MQCDNLIKKLLKAAAVTEGVYFGLTVLAMSASGTLVKLFYRDFSAGSGNLVSFGLLLPLFVKTLIFTGAFYAVWHFFNTAADPRFYRPYLVFLLIGLRVLLIPANMILRYFQTVFIVQKGVEIYSSYTVFTTTFLSPIAAVGLAAELILYIVLGMEWYRDRFLKEQAALAAQAQAAQAAVENGAPADVSEDSGWASYRDSLINEQAQAQPPEEFVFNNKPLI